MGEAVTGLRLEDAVGHWLRVVGLGIEIAAALVIVGGLVWSTCLFLRRRMAEQHYETYKIRIGRSLLLGRGGSRYRQDHCRGADLDESRRAAGLVLIRTFLSWMLVLGIEERWPWQRRSDRRVAPDGYGVARPFAS